MTANYHTHLQTIHSLATAQVGLPSSQWCSTYVGDKQVHAPNGPQPAATQCASRELHQQAGPAIPVLYLTQSGAGGRQLQVTQQSLTLQMPASCMCSHYLVRLQSQQQAEGTASRVLPLSLLADQSAAKGCSGSNALARKMTCCPAQSRPKTSVCITTTSMTLSVCDGAAECSPPNGQ